MGLFNLSSRRPKSLEDAAQFDETVSRPKAEPVEHPDTAGVAGHYLGRGAERRANRAANRPGKHRADS